MEAEDRPGQSQVSPRQTLSLDRGWLFHLGDIDSPVPNTHLAAYMANKAGYARGAARPAFDDSDWRELDLPHDWAVEQPFSKDAYLSQGYRPRGVAWYRRHFRLDECDRGRRLTIRFDGVATHCTVYVNGHLLHRNWCGYTGFTVDLTDVASYGDELNVIAVRVDAIYMQGWWYEGAGIYRHVWLEKTSLLHIAQDGVIIRTERRDDGTWETSLSVEVANAGTQSRFRAVADIIDPERGELEYSDFEYEIAAGSTTTCQQFFRPIRPALWSIEKPTLYRMRVRLKSMDGKVFDDVATPFGYRQLRFDANEGFFLNSQHIRLNGTCNHQDHAGVGVAVPESIWEFRVKRLKEMGCNAYRCAHNPPAPEFLDACDRLGMLVIDETRNFGPSPDHLAQLEAMVKRDRNHPCVITWSICNEEALQGTATGVAIARTMAAKVRSLDPTRPVTGAVSGGLQGEHCIADALDVIGINYQLPIYDAVHAKYPDKPIYAAETHCVCATRGEYCEIADKHVLPADDSYAASWGATARKTWRTLKDKPFVAGIFTWTGFDYRGEPTPHAWPCVNSFFGLLDTCGFAKDGFFLHKAWWTGEPFIHLLPHWNAPTDRIIAYSNCDEAELWLNGRSLGRRMVDPVDMAEWPVVYEPGEVRAAGYRGGREVATAATVKTGPAVALGLEVHPSMPATLSGDGGHALPVTVYAIDAAGWRVPTASNLTRFTIEGPGSILGVGNGDPTCHEADKASERSLFNGLAQVIVQSTGGAGAVRLLATADNLLPAIIEIPVAPVTSKPGLPTAKRRWLVNDWRVSPRFNEPSAVAAMAEQDMNSWERVKVTGGHLAIPPGQTGRVIYRARVRLPRLMQVRGAKVLLRGVIGKAEARIGDDTAAKSIDGSIGFALRSVPEGGVDVDIAIQASRRGAGLSGPLELFASS